MSAFRTAFWLLVILLALGQLQRIEVTVRGLPVVVYLHDVFLCGWLLALPKSLWRDSADRVKTFVKTHPAALWLLAWVGIGMLVHTFFTPSFTPWLYVLRLLVYGLFSLTLPLVFVRPIEKVDLRERYLIVGVVVALAGFVQYVLLPDTRFLKVFGWDDHYYRLISTLLDPSFTGMLLVLSWTYIQSIDWLEKHPKLHAALSAVVAIALGLTFSRASYLAFGVAVVTGVVLHRQHRQHQRWLAIAVISVVLVVISVGLAPKPTGEGVDLARTSTIQSRFSTNQTAVRQFTTQTFLLGDGLFFAKPTPAAQDHARVPDSLVVMLLQAVGVPGLLLVGWLSWQLFGWLMKNDRWMAAALLAVLTHSLFNNTLFEPFILMTLLGGFASIGQRSEK